MRNLNTPYKNFTKDDITQGFHAKHKAIDSVENSVSRKMLFGLPMCAMEDSKVVYIYRGDKLTPKDTTGQEKGYGVELKGLETGKEYLYWHSQPFFPVSVGDNVKRGQIITYMGNAGTVFSGGVHVPIEERLKAPHKGTHLHLQIWLNGKLVDPEKFINYSLQPTYTVIDQLKAMAVVLGKMSRVL